MAVSPKTYIGCLTGTASITINSRLGISAESVDKSLVVLPYRGDGTAPMLSRSVICRSILFAHGRAFWAA